MTAVLAKFSPQLAVAFAGLIAYGLIASNLIVLAITATLVIGSILLGSVSKLVSALALFVLLISSLNLIQNILLPDFLQVFRNNFVLALGFLATLLLASRFKTVIVSWQDDLTAVVISGMLLLFLVSKELFATGAAIASLLTNEDNAAWVSNAVSVTNGANQEPGIFGPLIDNSLYLTKSLASFAFPNLASPDHAALSVVLLGIMFLASIPFISVALLSWINGFQTKLTLSTHLLSVGLILASANFLFYGHLTAAIAIVALVLSTILATRISEIEEIGILSTGVIVLIFAVMAETWFPIAPLFILLGIYLLYSFASRSVNLTTKDKVGLFVSFAILALSFWHTLIARFILLSDVTESESGSALDGASFLLTIEGGVVGIGSLSLTVAILFSLLVLALNSHSIPEIINFMVPIAIGIVFAVLLRAINIFITQGTVNYGSRKMDTFIALAVIVYAAWLLVFSYEKSASSKVTVATVCALIFVLLAQIPSTDTLLGRNAFAGMDNNLNLSIGKAISGNAIVGKNLVCFTANSDPLPNEQRFAAYKCSRFSSAYTMTDNAKANGWRLAMLGQIDPSAFKQVTAKFPPDTKVLLIDSTKDEIDASDDSDWYNLIGNNWTVAEVGK
jgi:hypothetical protein